MHPLRGTEFCTQMFWNSEIVDILEFVLASELTWNHVTLWPKRYVEAIPNTRYLRRILHDLDVGIGSSIPADADKKDSVRRSVFERHGNAVGYEQPRRWQYGCHAAMADMLFQ